MEFLSSTRVLGAICPLSHTYGNCASNLQEFGGNSRRQSRCQRGKQITELVVDLARVIDGSRDFVANQLAISTAQSMGSHLHGTLGHTERFGNHGEALDAGPAAQRGLYVLEERPLAGLLVFGPQGTEGPLQHRQRPGLSNNRSGVTVSAVSAP